ncbi:hypothetical protein ACJIZ3_025414 [Penstemon smallii]|uniref:Protein kinase domain-containing protein n=1 Tax=Penstemon smallii TaxID=265156 RepID=A0ABD3TX31_9LAMI
MSRDLKKGGKVEKGCDVSEKVVVAVKASKEIPKTALVWALTHVVKPGDCINLLVLVSSHASGRKLWGFPRFAGDCASGNSRSYSGTIAEQKSEISDSCSQMILQLHDVYNPNKINVKIKIVSGTPCGSVAAEAKRNQANWVVLDKQLKHEEKRCMEELQCNIVVMKRSQPKVLRLNLVGSPKKEQEVTSSVNGQSSEKQEKINESLNSNSTRGPLVTPSSSPETFTATEVGTSSVSSSDPGTSPFFITEIKDSSLKKEELLATKQDLQVEESSSDSENDNLSSSSSLRFQPWMAEIITSHCQSLEHLGETSGRSKSLLEKLAKIDDETAFGSPSYRSNSEFSGNLREVISLSRAGPPGPPPLCSICQHKAPVFGKPPRWFTYAELEHATGGFSQANFLAEGGYGSVHRGVLPDGRAIAVKQHKLASSQGDQEFCSEVEVLSCAQHRNVVMLIGFCIEDGRRLLVYEYICNGSLDSHLYDFGLARWQPDGETGVETRVIGTFGYLAPEYAQSGQITEKADVYSFGVVLVELVTGRKAVDLNRPKGQQCLTEWARPLLEAYAIDELVDPRIGNNYLEHEVYCMLHAASLCIRRDPQTRPRMSQVLRILEGDAMDSSHMFSPGFDVGSRSGRMWSDQQNERHSGPIVKEPSCRFSSNISLNSRTNFGEREKGRTSYENNL